MIFISRSTKRIPPEKRKHDRCKPSRVMLEGITETFNKGKGKALFEHAEKLGKKADEIYAEMQRGQATKMQVKEALRKKTNAGIKYLESLITFAIKEEASANMIRLFVGEIRGLKNELRKL